MVYFQFPDRMNVMACAAKEANQTMDDATGLGMFMSQVTKTKLPTEWNKIRQYIEVSYTIGARILDKATTVFKKYTPSYSDIQGVIGDIVRDACLPALCSLAVKDVTEHVVEELFKQCVASIGACPVEPGFYRGTCSVDQHYLG